MSKPCIADLLSLLRRCVMGNFFVGAKTLHEAVAGIHFMHMLTKHSRQCGIEHHPRTLCQVFLDEARLDQVWPVLRNPAPGMQVRVSVGASDRPHLGLQRAGRQRLVAVEGRLAEGRDRAAVEAPRRARARAEAAGAAQRREQQREAGPHL
eukprot:CAMPEP_0168397340 /NCGR_PEP_ID=MMETSP0228-20121227/21013_1 /TAXON_ID=133427 /ORGANISM="Protoceratium reticulatum, Strain CCCM 535 (=CCMP 1889)" /LENGTH=150 /DNA_ID=CAMNT_0008410809 /DNA_START=226 /DNA_END=674 /DNA_ORIENTATION=+